MWLVRKQKIYTVMMDFVTNFEILLIVMCKLGEDCTDEKDCNECDIERALKSSKLRIPFTRVNTVILEAKKEEYTEGSHGRISGSVCSNVNPVKVITCRNVGLKHEYCKLKGSSCKLYHSVKNGHLFYRQIECAY